MTPRDLAAGIRRLRPCARNPERFHLERDQIAHAVARMDAGDPCGSCPASRLRRLLASAGAALRRQRAAVAERDRLLRLAVARPARRRLRAADPRQIPLFPEVSAA